MNVEKRLRDLEANAQERAQSVPPSPEVLEQLLAEMDAAWGELGQLVKVAKEEGRQIVDGSKYDHTPGPNHDLLAVIVDPEIKAACRRALDASPIGPVLLELPQDREIPPRNDHTQWLMRRLIWDEGGTPWAMHGRHRDAR